MSTIELIWQSMYTPYSAVEIMGRLASKGIKAMEKAGIDMSESLDVTKLSQDLCSQDEFKKYQPFAEYSCIKIMNDHKYHFLNVFAGVYTKSICWYIT